MFKLGRPIFFYILSLQRFACLTKSVWLNFKVFLFSNIKKNLSELTDAHEKLRFLLQELEALTKKN